MARHETEIVRSGSLQACIDLQLAPIIRWLWGRGIKTLQCCQGDVGKSAYIVFKTCRDLEMFLEALLGDKSDRDFTDRVLPNDWVGNENLTFKSETKKWRYDMKCNFGACDIRFCAGVYFPPEDIPEVMERLMA
jgi:hypothetical protein